MAQVQLSSISLAFGQRDILRNITFTIGGKDRIALTGANGSGKTTLMKIAAGISRPDSGVISREAGTSVSYLPQGGVEYRVGTLLEEAEKGFELQRRLVLEKDELGQRLGDLREGDPQTDAMLLAFHHLEERILDSGYYRREERIEQVLLGLGFSREDFTKEAAAFSGGWQMRIALARILLEYSDILLLDEPTNYLDIEAREWLSGYLGAFHGSVLLVSHDRHFLDATMTEVMEIFNGDIKRYKGTYSAYEKRRKEELEQLIGQYERQTEEIEKVEEFINRFRYNASKAKMVQSRIKYLEKLPRIEIPESMKRMGFSFPEPPHSGKIMLELSGLGKTYGDNLVFSGLDLTVERGEKIAVAGRNGAGKTTLLRILSGTEADHSGTVRPGTGVRIGYFCQDAGTVFTQPTVIQEVEAGAPTSMYPRLRSLLGGFLFRGDDIYKPIDVLSGGEKSRLALLKLLLSPFNLLIMDEPTNHLDLTSKHILLDALKAFSGTIIFVSHDRHFLENLATKLLEMENRKGTLFYGDYRYYLWKKGNPAGEEEPRRVAGPPSGMSASGAAPAGGPSAADETGGRDRREEEKRRKGAYRKLQKEAEELLKRIEETEGEHTEMLRVLALPETYTDGSAVKALKERISKNEGEQARLYSLWEQTERRIGEMEREA